MAGRNGHLAVRGGRLILPKETKAERLKRSAKGLAAKIIGLEQRLDMQERISGALMNACLESGMSPALLEAKAKDVGLDLSVKPREEGEGTTEEASDGP